MNSNINVVTPRGETLTNLNRAYGHLDGESLVQAAIHHGFPGRVAITSSFGIEAAVTLHLVARVDRSTPVLMLDTGHLFPETRAYAETLIERLRLTDVRTFRPSLYDLAVKDPAADLHVRNPDQCCDIRKVRPLETALDGFDAWITGRKRIHGGTRTALPFIEDDGRTFKFNPLARWTAEQVQEHFETFALPRHPLEDAGYSSVGCTHCTSRPLPGADLRAGRWAGQSKTECGIHRRA